MVSTNSQLPIPELMPAEFWDEPRFLEACIEQIRPVIKYFDRPVVVRRNDQGAELESYIERLMFVATSPDWAASGVELYFTRKGEWKSFEFHYPNHFSDTVWGELIRTEKWNEQFPLTWLGMAHFKWTKGYRKSADYCDLSDPETVKYFCQIGKEVLVKGIAKVLNERITKKSQDADQSAVKDQIESLRSRLAPLEVAIKEALWHVPQPKQPSFPRVSGGGVVQVGVGSFHGF